MPSAVERRRNNVRTGIFVSIALIIGGAVIATLGGLKDYFARMAAYEVFYDVDSGVKNLKAGAEVRVGGVDLGAVTAVVPQFEEGRPFERVLVEFELVEQVNLYADARIFIKEQLIGSGAWLDITSVGTEEAGAAVGPIEGATTAGNLANLLGPQIAEQLPRIMERAEEIMNDVKEFAEFIAGAEDLYDRDVKPTLDNVQVASADIQALTGRVRSEDWPRWAGQVDEVMTWATGFTDALDDAIAEGRGLMTDGRALLADNRPQIDETVTNVRDASADVKAVTARARDETMAQVQELLARGQDAMDEVVAAVERVRTDYEPWSEDFSGTLGNARLTSQQLKLAAAELRRSPWKLLYRPSSTELEHEFLYEAARSFALAASDVKAASESMQRVLDEYEDVLRDDPQLLEKVRRNLVDPLDRYERAQNRLFDVLLEDAQE